jgi:hypothetical protein
MATVDLTKASPEAMRYFKRNVRHAGKGDLPRNCWTRAFRSNYDRIFKKPQRHAQSHS